MSFSLSKCQVSFTLGYGKLFITWADSPKRRQSCLTYLLPFFLFKVVTTNFTHTSRDQRLNLQPKSLFFLYDTHIHCFFNLWLQLLFVEPVSVCISVFNLRSAKKEPLLRMFQILYYCIPSWSGCYFPKQPTTMSCYLKLCLSVSFRVFLIPLLLMVMP